MKRMFIPVCFRGEKIGRALAECIIGEGRAAGYKRMRLDTSHRQKEAIGLYESAGFKRIASYYELPHEMQEWLVFMEMEL